MGLDDPNGMADQKTVGELAAELRKKQGDGFILLLAHRNNKADAYAAAGIDLTLAGHAHGGLIRLPFTDGLIGPSREWLPTYTAGLYKLKYGQMVVSRGLGNGERTLRLLNRPHIPLVILHSAA
jgi:predicted MPP superfamily phosphohydrolase